MNNSLKKKKWYFISRGSRLGHLAGDPRQLTFQFESEDSPGRTGLQMKYKGSWLEDSLLLREGQYFCSIQAFNQLDKNYPLYKGNLLYSMSINLSVNLIQNIPYK